MLTGLTAFWLDRPATSAPTTSSPTPTCPRSTAAARCSSSGSRWCRWSAWCAATSPARAGRTTRRRARSAGSSCPPGLRESEQLPEPIFTPATKAELGDHDENVDFDRAAEIVGDRGAARGAAPPVDRDLRARRRARARARDHPGGHEVRVRPPAPTARSCSATRCSRPTPRASGPPTATSPATASRASTSSTCATGPSGSGWDKSPPAPELPDDVVERHARALRRGLRADRRRALRRAGWSAPAREGAGAHQAQGGHPRSAGPGRRAGAARARLRGREQRPRRARWSSSTWRTRRRCRRCASGCWPTR